MYVPSYLDISESTPSFLAFDVIHLEQEEKVKLGTDQLNCKDRN